MKLAEDALGQHLRQPFTLRNIFFTAPSPLGFEHEWRCDCGALLEIGIRKFQAQDLIRGVLSALICGAIGLFSGVIYTHSIAFVIVGFAVTALTMAAGGGGKHEVWIVEQGRPAQ